MGAELIHERKDLNDLILDIFMPDAGSILSLSSYISQFFFFFDFKLVKCGFCYLQLKMSRFKEAITAVT